MFVAAPVIQPVPLYDGHECLVIDNALQNPRAWVDLAAAHRDRFAPSDFAYPGIELLLPDDALAALDLFFMQHIRQRLGGRRTLGMTGRFSLATLMPDELRARQWLCHRDSLGLPDDQCMAASVLYLFQQPALGGTSFYRPRRSEAEIDALTRDRNTLDNLAFAQAHPEVAHGYQIDSNHWFERVATVAAKWNRLIFYNGSLFHSPDLQQPARLSPDPLRGRLTVNGFFTCRRRAA